MKNFLCLKLSFNRQDRIIEFKNKNYKLDLEMKLHKLKTIVRCNLSKIP